MKILVSLLFTYCVMLASSVLANDINTAYNIFESAPIVPIEIVVQGRQDVVQYLLKQVDHVRVSFGGDSIVGNNADQYITRDELAKRGYIHRGSADELFSAVGKTAFSASVVKTPRGYYDVRTWIEFQGIDNKILLTGSGNLNIQEGPGQIIFADTFEPWVWIQGDILVKRGGLSSGAMFVPANGQSTSSDILYQNEYNNGTPFALYDVPVQYLGEGNLIINDNNVGGVIGWNLKTGEFLVGKKVAAVIGTIQSNEAIIIKNPQSFSQAFSAKTKDIIFYRSDGKVYGRFPLIQLVNASRVEEFIFPTIKIWGTDEVLPPKDIKMENIFTDPSSPVTNGSLPTKNGSFYLDAPAGSSFIKMKFDIDDESAGPNFGKG